MAEQTILQVSEDASFTIGQATTSVDIDAIRTLFTAYTEWLNIDLTFQSFSNELASLPGAYGPPRGALLLARATETQEPLGCVALRPLELQPGFHSMRSGTDIGTHGQSHKFCEIKRLFTVPAARGKGIARALVRLAILTARREGYHEAFLDTLARMEAAVSLYKSEGFEETERYYENPMDGVLYMSQKLLPETMTSGHARQGEQTSTVLKPATSSATQ